MIQTKKVEIRAFKKDNKGIYHEKHGVFIDSDNNYVSLVVLLTKQVLGGIPIMILGRGHLGLMEEKRQQKKRF